LLKSIEDECRTGSFSDGCLAFSWNSTSHSNQENCLPLFNTRSRQLPSSFIEGNRFSISHYLPEFESKIVKATVNCARDLCRRSDLDQKIEKSISLVCPCNESSGPRISSENNVASSCFILKSTVAGGFHFRFLSPLKLFRTRSY
jgi:hypothetical protein